MQLKIEKKYLASRLFFFFGMLYILMRPFLTNYVSSYCKYIFMIIVAMAVLLTFLSKRYVGKIGYKELFLLIISYIYILCNAYLFGGTELFSMSITSYIFYTFPIIIMPLLLGRINWKKVFAFVSLFGVVDAGISIIEFISRKQMFPMSEVEGEVGTITKAGAYIVRTYGLQGSYFILAEVLCFCGFCAFYLYRFEKSKLHMFAWITICIGILTTGSRGYYVSFACGMIVMFLCERFFGKNRETINRKTLLYLFLAIGIISVGTYLILGTNFTTGNNNLDVVLNRIRMVLDWEGDSANVQRVNRWIWAIDYWQQSLLFGHGACCSDIRYSGYIKVTESGVLKRLVELGLLGTIIQYATMFAPLKRGIKNLGTHELDSKCLPFIGTIVAFLVEDCVLERYTAPEYTVLLWLSIAYLAYYNRDCEVGNLNKSVELQ